MRWNVLSKREVYLIAVAMTLAFVVAFTAGRWWGYYG